MSESQSLLSSARFRAAKNEMLQTIAEASARVHSVKPSSAGNVREKYLATIKEFNMNRGRDLYFQFLSSGLGSGPFVELADGSVKYDMITGIGINFFGHSNPALMSEVIDALPSDIMQGNLEPGYEAQELLAMMLEKTVKGSRLTKGWLTTCGTMANEIALKIIRQKKFPATKVMAFRDCFSGRSTAMQEITDNPGYRQGQPVYGEAYHIPFYDPKLGLDASTRQTLTAMKDHVTRYPGMFAALMLEIVQGEGGFNAAPREYYVAVFEEAKKAGMAIWADEIQTFGRTGEYFAFQTFDIASYIDVATVAKMLLSSIVLFSDEYNPKPGLVAGTFSGGSGALKASKKILKMLDEDGFLGKEGKISRLSNRFISNFEKLSESNCKGMLGEYRAIGGMVAFTPFEGKMEDVKATLLKLFDLGVVAFYCGHGPYLIRMLPPLGAMTEKDVDQVCGLIDQALCQVAAERKKS